MPDTADAEKAAFLSAVRTSLDDGRFIRIALGKYRGEGEDSRCTVDRVVLKDVPHLRFVTRRGRQEFTSNATADAALQRLGEWVGGQYLSATLHTTTEDVTLVFNRKRISRLARGKPTSRAAPTTDHNRTKDYLVDVSAPFLARLGVTHSGGEVKPSMYAKFRQIERFVEIVDQLVAASELKDAPSPHIVDIGAGKGYLTFALHDHLMRRLGKAPHTTGIEANASLVAQCNAISLGCGMTGLTFEAMQAEGATPDKVDVLIALHACDTATDDAIHLGLMKNAALIVCAPCCQHEIAPQLKPAGSPLEGLLKYGLFKQRQADLFTDAARALLLEANGYEVRIIEFTSTEHTAKNLLITGARSAKVDRAAARAQYERLAALAGFEHQHLADRLAPCGHTQQV